MDEINGVNIKEMKLCRKCLSSKIGVALDRGRVYVSKSKHRCSLCGKRKHIVYKLRKHAHDRGD